MKPGFALLPLILPISVVIVFLVVPSQARVPAFLALIGTAAAVALGVRRQGKS